MRCSSCDQPKQKLFPKESSLIRGVTLYLCRTCIDKKMEPRWTIILAGRRDGPDSVRDFIVKQRYLGKKIEAEEIIR
jgi:hypothetical protein